MSLVLEKICSMSMRNVSVSGKPDKTLTAPASEMSNILQQEIKHFVRIKRMNSILCCGVLLYACSHTKIQQRFVFLPARRDFPFYLQMPWLENRGGES